MDAEQNILEIKNLEVYFPVRRGLFKSVHGNIKAVDRINLAVIKGEILGIVGESGCGKTTLGKSILQLIRPTNGSVVYNGKEGAEDLCKLDDRAMSKYRKNLQIVFQDPHSSLNPAFTIYGSLQDPLKKFGIDTKAERRQIIGDLLEAVNLRREYMDKYPHEISSGQRRHICIARALLVDPELIVCDEAVSALDVSIQAQVLQLLLDLRSERNLTYIFITPDLSVTEYICDRIAVMYLGKIVELAKSEDLFNNTQHPYTEALLSAKPVAKLGKKSRIIILEGDVPSPMNPPTGCPFHPRCHLAMDRCKTDVPELQLSKNSNDQNHYASCHLLDRI